jgi:hypothetical protein
VRDGHRYPRVTRAAALADAFPRLAREWRRRCAHHRNRAKREYAEAYGRFRFASAPHPEPAGLSYMAAQAVRMDAEALIHDEWESIAREIPA